MRLYVCRGEAPVLPPLLQLFSVHVCVHEDVCMQVHEGGRTPAHDGAFAA